MSKGTNYEPHRPLTKGDMMMTQCELLGTNNLTMWHVFSKCLVHEAYESYGLDSLAIVQTNQYNPIITSNYYWDC